MGDADVGVATVVTLLAAVWTVRRVIRWRRALPGERGVATVLLLVAAMVLLAAGAVETRHQWTQARAADLVRELTQDDQATAACQRLTPDLFDTSAHAGFVSWDAMQVATLRRQVCRDLFAWMTGPQTDPTLDQVIAVHVVVHEAMHVGGERNESRAECFAMQADARAAVVLGASPAAADALAARYHAEVYPRMRDGYTTAECAEGGDLDLTPDDRQFP